MKLVKVSISPENDGEIICPRCAVTKGIRIGRKHDPKQRVGVKCTCGHTFLIQFEFTRYQRKIVHIPGILFDPVTEQTIDHVLVTALSVVDLGFEVGMYYNIERDDTYGISFILDDELQSNICREITVKRIKGNCIGAEFCNRDAYNHALDFYTFSHSGLPQV